MTTMYSRFDYIDAARATGEQFVALARSVADPEALVPTLPGWSIADCIGHVSTNPARFRKMLSDKKVRTYGPDELADLNAKQIANLTTRDIGTLTEVLLDDLDSLLDRIAHLKAQVPTVLVEGQSPVRADSGLGTVIGEFLVHGYDIARALHRPWSLDPEHSLLALRGRHQLLPVWLDRVAAAGHTATYQLHFRGFADEGVVYQFEDGALTVDPEDPPWPDCHIAVDTATSLLVTYHRITPRRAFATGHAMAWGRRPWLALRLASRFAPA